MRAAMRTSLSLFSIEITITGKLSRKSILQELTATAGRMPAWSFQQHFQQLLKEKSENPSRYFEARFLNLKYQRYLRYLAVFCRFCRNKRFISDAMLISPILLKRLLKTACVTGNRTFRANKLLRINAIRRANFIK
jgi:hypothetical protein